MHRLKTTAFGSRGQVDLENMESTPDRGFVKILNYQDDLKKIVVLWPMKSKSVYETVYNLIDNIHADSVLA